MDFPRTSSEGGSGELPVKCCVGPAGIGRIPTPPTYIYTVATPVISPAGGTFGDASSLMLTLSTRTDGASIYYTVDGSTPGPTKTLYTGPFAISSSLTLRVIAVKASYLDSAIVGASYTVNTLAVPVITPAGGTFLRTVSVTLSCATAGSSLFYTTDGTAPTTSSTPYTGAFDLTGSCTVKVLAHKTGLADKIASADFVVNAWACPTPSLLSTLGYSATGASASAYGGVWHPGTRKLWLSDMDNARMEVLSTVDNTSVAVVNEDADLFNAWVQLDKKNDKIWAVDQRGYVDFFNPTTRAKIGTTLNATGGGGPGAPPMNGAAVDNTHGYGLIVTPTSVTPLVLFDGNAQSILWSGNLGSPGAQCVTFNEITGKFIIANSPSNGSFPYYFFDAVSHAVTQSSLTIGPAEWVKFVPELGVLVVLNTDSHLRIINATTDTVIADLGSYLSSSHFGSHCYNPCTGKLYVTLTHGIFKLDPASSYAAATLSTDSADVLCCDPDTNLIFGKVASAHQVKTYIG